MSNVGHNSGEVTSAEKVKLHYRGLKEAYMHSQDSASFMKDRKSQAKADGVDPAALMKVIKAEAMEEAKAEREKNRKEQAEEYADLLQLKLEL